MGISLVEANKMCEVAIAKADELGIKISVAVCDWGGRLISFDRMDGAFWASVYGSQGKATASTAFWPSQRASDGASRPPDYPRHHRRRRWSHDPGPGRDTCHQERPSLRVLAESGAARVRRTRSAPRQPWTRSKPTTPLHTSRASARAAPPTLLGSKS